jgi:Tripartite tricarboxylate transporter TctB family
VGRDRWSAAGLALLAITYLVVGRRYPLDTLATPGPGVIPLVAGVALLAAAIWLFIVARARPAREVGGLLPRSPFVLAAALVPYTALLTRLGFIASSLALAVLASRLMGARGWWRPVVLALGVAAAAHVLFARWLGVPLP